jgi:hypothetical protein
MLGESLGELKESVCSSISPQESYVNNAFKGYGVFIIVNGNTLGASSTSNQEVGHNL